MEDIKTVRILFTDKDKDIPVTLYDSFLKRNVELNPDAIISEQFATELVNSFACYKIIDKGTKVDKKAYKIRPDYKQKELQTNFDQLTPEERELVVDFAQGLIDDRAKAEEKANTTKVGSEIKPDGKTDNSTKDKGNS